MRGRLVSNTGPIIALGSIDCLDILKRIFEEVILSETVHDEIMQGGKDFTGLRSYRKAAWIKVQSLGISGQEVYQNYRFKSWPPRLVCAPLGVSVGASPQVLS